jgi:geranylgeranyl diphosphate synthase, type I
MTVTTSVLDRGRTQLEPAMQAAVARLDPSSRLHVSYHLGWCDVYGNATPNGGGKGIRPALAMLSAEAVGAAESVGLPGAVAVELVHNFSLLHDDVLDGDLERRHRATVWAVWGMPTAILAGDTLLALAHEIVLEADGPGNASACHLLAQVTRELTRGQTQDLAFEKRDDVTLDECLDMAGGKTGSLLAAAASIGAILAGADETKVAALKTFGAQFGLAFQLVDDVLGIWGDPAVTGKSVYSDLSAKKKSLPVTWALSYSRQGPAIREWLTGDGEPGPETLHDMAELLAAAGAKDWALTEAARRMGLAEAALNSVALNPRARADMIELATYVVERDS